MKTTKRTLKFFSVADWEEEEIYLRKMHQQGWKLVSGGIVCTFARCEPEDVIYQLDYNEASHKDSEAYRQMFADSGWEYIQDFAGYSYFRKPAAEMQEHEEGIFCDDASRLEMVKRVWNGRMIPILVVFLLIVIPYIATGVDWWKSRINGFILGAFPDVHLYFHPYGHQILAAAGKISMKMKACNA